MSSTTPTADDTRVVSAARIRLAMAHRPELFRNGKGAIQDFADRYGLTRTGASRILSAIVPVPTHVLLAFARDVGTTVDWLIDEDMPEGSFAASPLIPVLGRPGEFLSIPQRWADAARLPPASQLVVVEWTMELPGLVAPLPELVLVQRISHTAACRGAVLMRPSGRGLPQPLLCDLYLPPSEERWSIEPWDGSPAELLPYEAIAAYGSSANDDEARSQRLFQLGKAVGTVALGTNQVLALCAPHKRKSPAISKRDAGLGMKEDT